MHILGNGISIPHALICILNAIKLIKNPLVDIDIQEYFAKVLSHRMKAQMVEVVEVQEGIVIQQKHSVDAFEAMTQQMQSFVPLHVRSPTAAFVVQVESGLKIREVVELLTGPSCPSVLEIEIGEKHLVQMMPHDRIQSDVCIIKAGVPSILNMKDSLVHTTSGDMIVILTSSEIIVCRRKGSMHIHEITQMVHDFFPDKVDIDARPCNEFGQQHPEENACPDCVFMTTSRERSFKLDSHDNPTFRKVTTHFEMVCSLAFAIKVIQLFDRAAISEGCKCLGWAIHIIFIAEKSSNRTKIALAPITGALSVTIDQIQMYVMTHLAIVNMPELVPSVETDTISLKVKLWGTYVWEGPICRSTTLAKFIEPWNKSRYIMNADETLQIRAIIKGKQANPRFCNWRLHW